MGVNDVHPRQTEPRAFLVKQVSEVLPEKSMLYGSGEACSEAFSASFGSYEEQEAMLVLPSNVSDVLQTMYSRGESINGLPVP